MDHCAPTAVGYPDRSDQRMAVHAHARLLGLGNYALEVVRLCYVLAVKVCASGARFANGIDTKLQTTSSKSDDSNELSDTCHYVSNPSSS